MTSLGRANGLSTSNGPSIPNGLSIVRVKGPEIARVKGLEIVLAMSSGNPIVNLSDAVNGGDGGGDVHVPWLGIGARR